EVRLRADRLGMAEAGVLVVAETVAESVADLIGETRPAAVVVASIQTLHTSALGSAPGSVGQVRESAALLVARAKASGVACFLIGHVTKEGTLAGPRVLEHLVDTVLYFEGDGAHALRVLRAVKNRFGSTNEVAVFEMGEGGLAEVPNPSAAFLAERPAGAPGSAVLATLEGSRPLLVEIQALVSRSGLALPRRTAIGLDPGRVALLLAVLEKRMGLPLHDQDVFLNVAGGLRVEEPAADLAVVAAVASSARGRALADDVAVWGEVGLTGEVRAVGRSEARLREAARQGFRRCVLPASNARGLAVDGTRAEGVATLEQLLELHDMRGGGVYSFSYFVLGPVASFVAVASIMVSYILTACISTVSAVINGTAFLPLGPATQQGLILAIIWAIAGLNILGIRENARVTFGIFIVAAFVLLNLIALGLLHMAPGSPAVILGSATTVERSVTGFGLPHAVAIV